jgi:hypothetical protein
MTIFKRYLLVVVAVLALSAVAVAATAGTDDSNPTSQDVPQVTTVDPQAREAMAVFEGSRTGGDALRADLAEKIDSEADFGMNPRLSRRSIGNMTNSVYVIPARDRVCAALTVGEGATVSCRSVEEVEAGKAAAGTVILETGGIAVYGVVPDGVRSVSVQTGKSDSAGVDTTDNAYYTVVPAGTPLRTVSYVGPSGPVEFPIFDPARILDK